MNNEPCKTCGTCKHWIKVQSLDLSKQEGDCREGPPTPHPMMDQRGRMLGQLSIYNRLPLNFPACDKHEPRLDLAVA